MKRRDFLTGSAVAGVATVCGAPRAAAQAGAADWMPKLTPPAQPAQLNLCLQWGAIPGGEIKEKLDFLEANGFAAVFGGGVERVYGRDGFPRKKGRVRCRIVESSSRDRPCSRL